MNEPKQEPAYSFCMERFEGLTKPRVEELLQRIRPLRAGVIGDVCLDVYWEADLTRSVLSLETPHFTLPVVGERYSLGAAGNVASNLKALGCKEVSICSVIGKDWRGELLRQHLANRNIDSSYLLVDDRWCTPAYCKPIRIGLQGARQEDPRLDFQNFHSLPIPLEAALIERLDAMAERFDILAVTDQLSNGVIGEVIRIRLAYWAERGKIIVVDSRERIGAYKSVIVKPNEVEASRWFGSQIEMTNRPLTHWADMARHLSDKVGGACCLTLGSEGAIWTNADSCVFVPTRTAEPPIDIVGAGDGFAATLLCALGAQSGGPEALALAHLSSSVIIRKIGTTGTATPQEILDMHSRIMKE